MSKNHVKHNTSNPSILSQFPPFWNSSTIHSVHVVQLRHLCSVMSDSLWPHGLQPTRLLCPWNFPGKNTGVGYHFLPQGNLPDPGIEPLSLASPSLAGGFFICWATREAGLLRDQFLYLLVITLSNPLASAFDSSLKSHSDNKSIW